MDRRRKQLTRATVVAAAVITAGLTVVIGANRVARADLDPQAADYAVMDEDLYGALVVAILGFVVCLVVLGIHWVVHARGAQGRDAPSTSPPLWLPPRRRGAIRNYRDRRQPGLVLRLPFRRWCSVPYLGCLRSLLGGGGFRAREPSRHWRQDGVIATGQLGAGLAWRCAGTEAPVPVPKTHLSSCVLNRLCLLLRVISR